MKFRKKPVVIEAFCYRTDSIHDWFMDRVTTNDIIMHDDHCLIHTLEGTMRGEKVDYIIQGVSLEIYPCKSDIFALTYEAAE